MKPNRWGIKDNMLHLYGWWKPDEHHWRDLSTDGGNRPVSKCGMSRPADYHDGVEWLNIVGNVKPDMDVLPDTVVLCKECAGVRVTIEG
jgi:hypothetical protein